MFKKFISKVVLSFALVGCIFGAYEIDAHAQNSYLDVTVSNISGVTSQDPYSLKTKKDDGSQSFVIRLTKLERAPKIYFTAYNENGYACSSAKTYYASYVGNRKFYNYDTGTAYAWEKYYLYATAPLYYGGVHAVGVFCP